MATTTTLVDNRNQYYNHSNRLPIDIDEYSTNDIFEVGNIVYIGMENKNHDWYIKKIDTTVNTEFRHATGLNNPTITDYSTAITNKETLVYGLISESFN